MALIAKRRIRLEVEWDKRDADNLRWRVIAWGYIDDDSEVGGDKEVMGITEPATMSRGQFRELEGLQIENQVNADATAALQLLGSGAGDHTVQDDLGE